MRDTKYITADNIKYYRKQAYMTQMELAEEADVSYDTIKRSESGNRGMSLESLMNIARALKVEPAFLLYENSKDIDMPQIEKLYTLLGGRSKAEQNYLFFMIEKLVEGLSLLSN